MPPRSKLAGGNTSVVAGTGVGGVNGVAVGCEFTVTIGVGVSFDTSVAGSASSLLHWTKSRAMNIATTKTRLGCRRVICCEVFNISEAR